MASAQLIKEELQSTVAVSGVNALPSMDDDESAGAAELAAQLGVTDDVLGDVEEQEEAGHGSDDAGEDEDEDHFEGQEGEEEEDEDEDDDEEEEEYEADSAEEEEVEDDELDAEGDEDITSQPSRTSKRIPRRKSEDGDEEVEEEEEEEGEEGEDGSGDDESGSSEDEDTVAKAEGVGAVKIRPGETDNEEDSEGSAEAAESPSDEEWEDPAENEEDEDDDEDEPEEDTRGVPTCISCKQSQQQGPGGEDGALLTCSRCGEKAVHRECAQQDGGAQNASETWKCSHCLVEMDKSNTADEMVVDVEGAQEANDAAETVSARMTRRSTGPKASPARRSVSAPNAEPHPEEHTDSGARVLRRRGPSPSLDGDESGMSLRKRRRHADDNLVQEAAHGAGDLAPPQSARSLRIKPAPSSLVSVVKKTRSSLVLKMRVSGAELRQIFTKRRKMKKKSPEKSDKSARSSRPSTGRGATATAAATVPSSASLGAVPMLLPGSSYSQPFYTFFDKDAEEQKGKPYGGILTEAEADTSKTFPTAEDRRKFDESKQKAEEGWRARLLAMQAEQQLEAAPLKKSKKAVDPASQIECIDFGGWEIDTWYAAPYPEEYSRNRVLYICEFCLKYMNSDYVAWRHKLKCPAKHPPGDEIYRHASVSFFEVDGRKNPVYCQNLCLLAKLFLGSKTLYYDVEPFLFYVLCEYDEFGYHFVGYFSKEKRASSQNNVSCILTLPIHQRKGYGNLLIDFSYLLTRVEKKTGSPEKPLSDMGLVSYRNYWRLVMCRYILKAMDNGPAEDEKRLGLSVKQISDDTGMTADDVISALEGLRCLVRDPLTGLYAFRVDVAYCQEYVAKWEKKKYVSLNPAALTWTPYVMGHGNATNFELGPALTAIAPREEEEEEGGGREAMASEPKLAVPFAGGAVLPPNGTGGLGGEDAGAGVLRADGVAVGEKDKLLAEIDAHLKEATVLASTEPNDGEQQPGEADRGGSSTTNALVALQGDVAGEEGSASQSREASDRDRPPRGEKGGGSAADRRDANIGSYGTRTATASDEDWFAPYADIPATRFVVYPPISARRLNYARATIGRPAGRPAGRLGSGTRGRSRFGAGASGRSAASRPRSTGTGRRKTGGTGRGPGRWPKGTKKSDYGNAESGPGLPPSWKGDDEEKQASEEGGKHEPTGQGRREGGGGEDEADEAEVEVEAMVTTPVHGGAEAADDKGPGEGEGENAVVEDVVQVQTPSVKVPDRRNGLNGGLLSTEPSRSSPRLNKTRFTAPESQDTVMVDVDAEGEEE